MDLLDNGFLPSGIHEFSHDEFFKTFINDFTTSQSRRYIYSELLSTAKIISTIMSPIELWLDGSFVTSKINPNDIDFLIFISINDISAMTAYNNLIHKTQYVDPYITIIPDDDSQRLLSINDYCQLVNNRNYWRGQFGFDREDKPKGIVKISWTEITAALNGGAI